ncbi:MFS general substrate transporter [Exidia glandulosa HHB12029]|uniref:MFS general substrate transporter n=1 Tax=Exidia glandulosa HHB12029 TaxID=1314781 RepID=A0A165HTV9_EXIGL|nr:MFS general substrate transporter [Exidia glandulosa HHB12029]
MTQQPVAAAADNDERTPLLARADADEDEEEVPLPMLQVTLLCAGRVAEGMAFFTIFPFVNQMIAEVGGVPEAEVGFWSGWIESVFSFTSMIVMLFWGRASDNFGRKPVLTICLAGMAASAALFGFATDVWQMIALRSLAGVFGGAVVTIRTMLSENSTARTQARAFSLFAFAGNLGIFSGPLIGGVFAKPASQYPSIFGRVQLFVDYPYLLPGLISGGFTGLVALSNFIWLKETLPEQRNSATKTPPPSIMSIILSPGVRPVLVIFLYAGLLGFLYTALIPVFYFTPIELGGFGFTPAQISGFIALAGASQAIWLLFFFPPLQKRYGTGNVLRGCATMYPIAFAVIPVFNVLLREGKVKLFWATAPAWMALLSGLSMIFAGVQLALNDISPGPHAFGTLNGIALSLSSGVRAISPASITSLYAYGVKHQILKGHLAWVVMVAIAAGFGLVLQWLPAKSEGRLPPLHHHASAPPASRTQGEDETV